MTLKEIAHLADVSISTVSRVVNQNDPKAASEDTVKRIWEIVRESGYIPNSAARTLKSGIQQDNLQTEPKSIACIFGRSRDKLNDLFFTTLAKSIEQEAFKNNYFVKYTFSAMDLSGEQILNHISEIQVDGIVILGRSSETLLSQVHKKFTKVVYTGLNPISLGYDQVICDGYDAACSAIDYLVKEGHTKIGYIGEVENEIRFKAYKDSMQKHGLSFSNEKIMNVKLSSEGGYHGAIELIKRKLNATALFCANDVTAIGVIKALKEMNIRVPEDMSVISIDDIDTAQYVSPMLTTVHIPLEELGKIAVQTLIHRIEKQHKLPMKISLPFYLVVRESCKSI